MPNMLDDPDRPMIHLPPQPTGLAGYARAIGDIVRAGLTITAWLVLATVGLIAAYTAIRVCLWGATEVLRAIGVSHG